MTNPFDDPDGRFQVLTNDEGQHSLWPVFAEVPAGWTVTLPATGRDDCLAWIEANWTDLRPAGLVAASAGVAAAAGVAASAGVAAAARAEGNSAR
ncbi:MbtH family protein [Kitasatospora sp. NPDC051984]|uniref:MbtH family protein n=1 Tax=Kitasatospora sp. NPDC051984 TaxID=3364059 RepID=UPI0037C9D511